MGTPVACVYAMVLFRHYKNSVILKDFHKELLYYRCYIDDIFGIWVPPDTPTGSPWDVFKDALNNWGNLKWKVEKPSNKAVFLDLEIQIQNSTISTKTYQKDMNLYLYIPPLSAHPPSCFKGLIAGELRRYWLQNNPDDFQKMLHKFIDRLLNRGHTLTDITPILTQAAATIDRKLLGPTPNLNPNNDTLFIHREFHPKDFQRQEIRTLYQEILEPHLDFDRMTVAMSRPKKLQDILSKSNLTMPEQRQPTKPDTETQVCPRELKDLELSTRLSSLSLLTFLFLTYHL
jgi:hypothetical protein